MWLNPFCARARKALDKAGKRHTYLEYGGYHNKWRLRLAIKMWAGWPTFPMVFIRGQLVGGAEDLERRIASGELDVLLNTE
ncbi:MAG: glutaredoxin [Myxococcota bacterium]